MKAPRAAELYARGVEICDPDLRVETAWSLDASVPIRRNRLGATATLFTSRFSDFIFLRNTSEVEHGFPVRHVSQGDAIFKGFEAETDFEMFHAGDRHLSLRLWSDLTLAERVEDAEPLPRIPPLRVGGGRGSAGVGGGLNYTHGPLNVSASEKNVARQSRVASYEEETHGYTMVDATARYRVFTRSTVYEFMLQGRNLSNTAARVHTSFLKDILPLPGHDIRLTYQSSF